SALRDFCDWPDVGNDRPRRAIRLDAEFLRNDLARQPLDIADDVRSCPGQPDIGRVDTQAIDQVKDFDLLLDGRAPDGGGLQPIAQRLVIEHDGPARVISRSIPVVNERVHETRESSGAPQAVRWMSTAWPPMWRGRSRDPSPLQSV